MYDIKCNIANINKVERITVSGRSLFYPLVRRSPKIKISTMTDQPAATPEPLDVNDQSLDKYKAAGDIASVL
jgi:hypothetical protein